jgi:uncharacterized membrane protein YqhA
MGAVKKGANVFSVLVIIYFIYFLGLLVDFKNSTSTEVFWFIIATVIFVKVCSGLGRVTRKWF